MEVPSSAAIIATKEWKNYDGIGKRLDQRRGMV
jgi:hypothetical protein